MIQKKSTRPLAYLLILIFIMFSIFPVVWMFTSSIKPRGEIYTIPPLWLPAHPTLSHYQFVIQDTPIIQYFINSLVIAVSTTLVSILIASFAAYGLSRFKFHGKESLALFILFSQMLPLAVLLVPLYVVFTRLGLHDTRYGLVFSYLIFTLPMTTWMLRGFFASIPKEVEDAAWVDGCSRLGILLRIVIPISMPAIIATATYAFIVAWQEFLFALVLTVSRSVRTLPIGISGFIGQFDINWGAIMAASTIVTLPVVILFLRYYNRFIEGFTEGMT
jgi:ABC-type glycerol-3-phosphate transport system permease component